MPTPKSIDVLISGGGPVGLTLAGELTRYGLTVRVLDKAPQRTDKSKALVVWSRTVEHLDRLGCGAAFVAAGLQVPGISIFGGGQRLGHFDFTGVKSPHPYALIVPQSDTERLLEEHLATQGVAVERGAEFLRFRETADGVESVFRRADGAEETVASRWLAGCDGAHSPVRHQLNLEFKGDTLQSDWMLGDIQLEGVQCPGQVELYWHADGVLALFPIKGSRYRMIADLAGGSHPADPTLEEVQAVLTRRGPATLRASSPIWLASFRINERKVSDYRVGRVFLAGDAAHIHSPAGGQGLNTGMQDACNLAWKLALVASGAGAEGPLLASYSPERSGIGDQILAVTSKATAVATLRGTTAQFVRNHAAALIMGIPWVREKAATIATELAVAYPHSPLHAKHPGGPSPAAGERAPVRAGETPVSSGRVPEFVAFGAGGDGFAAVAGRFPRLLDPIIRAPFSPGGLWLVRPDGYVFLATKEGAWDKVEEALVALDAPKSRTPAL